MGETEWKLTWRRKGHPPAEYDVVRFECSGGHVRFMAVFGDESAWLANMWGHHEFRHRSGAVVAIDFPGAAVLS